MKKHAFTLKDDGGADPFQPGVKVKLVARSDSEGVVLRRDDKYGYEVRWLAPEARNGLTGLYFFEELMLAELPLVEGSC